MQFYLTEEYLTGPALPWNLNLFLHFLLSYAILNPPAQTSQSVFLSLLPWRFPLPRFLFQSYHKIQDVPNMLCHTICIKCHGSDFGDFKSILSNLSLITFAASFILDTHPAYQLVSFQNQNFDTFHNANSQF